VDDARSAFGILFTACKYVTRGPAQRRTATAVLPLVIAVLFYALAALLLKAPTGLGIL